MGSTTRNLRLINVAGRELDGDHTLSGVFDRVLDWAERIFGLHTCAVLLSDEPGGDLRIAASRGYRPEIVASFRATPGSGVTGKVFASREPALVSDVRTHPAYVSGVPGATCEMAVPLVVQDAVIGVLDAEAVRSRAFSQEELDLFTLFAGHAASAVHNARLVERIRTDNARLEMRTRDLQALNEMAARIATITDPDALIEGALAAARRSLFFRSCALLLSEADDLVIRGTYGLDAGISSGLRLARGRGVSWRCFTGGRPILICDAPSDPDHLPGLRDCRCEMAAPLLAPSGILGVVVAESPKPGAFNDDSLGIFSSFAHMIAVALENARLHSENRQGFYQTIRMLAHALETRDSYTRGHSERVTWYAVRIAKALGLSERDVEVLEQAGLLHDIGKIGVCDAVLLKPGALDWNERAEIERHPVIGDEILHPVAFLREALDVVLHHHERYDGTGYPSALKGRDIPLVSRVIAVADAYDAMTSTRPYRQAMPHEAAVEELERLSGAQFDPEVVRAFTVAIRPS
jgi:putative nucleotidyltransferase with HDIG domain